MNKNLLTRSFTLIAGITIFSSTLCAMDQKAKTETQRQRFQKLFSEDEITYFHNKHVDPELKDRLDAVFCNPETENSLATLYDRETSDDASIKRAENSLIKKGFIFIDSTTHVYSHVLFSEFVFKHSYDPSNERLDASRIRYAQELQEKDICICIKAKIICPNKQAYMPYLEKEKLLPLVMIVAQKVNIAELHTLSTAQFNILKMAGFNDIVHPRNLKEIRNAGSLDDDIIVFDTEPRRAILNYPQKNTLKSQNNKTLTLQIIAASWLCMASLVAWKLLKS